MRAWRVMHLASGDLWGGAEAVVLALAREQHRSAPGTVSCLVMNPGRLATELQQSGIETIVLDESRQGLLALAGAAANELRRLQPNILHTHRQKENVIAVLAALSIRNRLARPRLVSTVHGMVEPVVNARNWRRRLIARINDFTLRHWFDCVVGVSREITHALSVRYAPTRVDCIHNGIAPNEQPSGPNTIRTSQQLNLLALGRLVPIKRFERLGEVADLISSYTGVRPCITLGGEGPLDAQLRNSLCVDVPTATIRMLGFVTDTHKLLDSTDALLVTSDHEGIPMVALEAISRGVPVFGFAVGGLPEIAATTDLMRLAPLPDVQALARAIVDYFATRPTGRRPPPPPDWPLYIANCAAGYSRLYATLLESQR